ncbi:MAG: HEAT repeat domain-containing protein, partial [Polyangiaceae bacterium]
MRARTSAASLKTRASLLALFKTRASLLAIFLLATSCASTPGLGAAERGDFAELKSDIAPRYDSGKLTNDDAAKLANAVASHEIASAKGDDGRARVRELAACAQELDDAFSDRMKTRDDAGAEAAQARIDAGNLDPDDVRDSVADRSDAWRAVGVRSLVEEEDMRARQKAFVDPSPIVRRAAFRAAAEAKDPRDVAGLAEAARLDPDGLARTDAVRAMGRIGGRQVVDLLRDVWTHGDDSLKDDIALAYSAEPSWQAGGREELRLLIAAEKGADVLAAAAAVLREHPDDAEMRSSSLALLARAIDRGTEKERLEALAISPLAPELLDSITKASHDDADSHVRVSALGRLTENQASRADA